jgi:Cdc6-like AAA superfamily ATPase
MTQQEIIAYGDNPFMAEALTYVYIAQYVRPDGPERAGVLEEDCQRYFSQINQLLSAGDIRTAHWLKHRGFITTFKGTQNAQSIIGNRLIIHKSVLEAKLEGVPRRHLQYLQDIIFDNSNDGRQVQIGREIGRSDTFDNNRPSYSCLLSNRDIRDMRDNLFQTLVTLNLMVKAYYYVATRGGETRDYYYVPAPELQSMFRDYLAKGGPAGYLWTEELEEMHSVFHILYGPSSIQNWEELDRKIPIRYRESVKEFINECIAKKVITEPAYNKGHYLTINDPLWYNTERTKRYQMPLLDFLRGQNRDSIIKIKDTKPIIIKEPEAIISHAVPTVSPKSGHMFRVMLGTKEDNLPVYWEPLALPNPHLLIVGSPGMGKTQTAKAIIFEAARQNIRSFVIDFANEYSDVVEFVLKPGDAVTVNPLDLLEGGPIDVVFRVSGILGKIFGLGDQQEGLVRNAIKNAYFSAGISEDPKTWSKPVPPFSSIKDYLDGLVADGNQAMLAQRTLTRLEPLFDLQVFSGNTQVVFDQIIKKGATLHLRDLPTEPTKLAVAEFFLRWLWHRVIGEGEIRNQVRLLIVMDEAHKLAYDDSPVADFLRQGRKYGSAVILSTQQPDDFQSKELAFQNTAYHMAFGCNSEKHAQAMAKQMVIGRKDQSQVAQLIRKLKPFEALVAGQSAENAEMIKIKPYHERIQKS